uniref:Tachykinin precursor 3b n=1 Tax=Myripristis murdjan TaxID=586833 RepID=A0A668AUY4_9TELE
MERVGNSWTLAALAALVILSCPVKSWCKEQTHKSPSQNKPESLPGDFADFKRFDDLDYDSFIGLMGRRIAGKKKKKKFSGIHTARDMDDVFVGLLGRKRSKPSECQQKGWLYTKRKANNKINLQYSVDCV